MPNNSGAQGAMQYDEQGRPYFLMADGRRNYVSPVAMGEQAPPDKTGIFRHGPEWNQNKGAWETPIDWGNILSMITAGGLTAGAASAAMGGAGAAGAAGGGMPALLAPASVLPAGGGGIIGGMSALSVPASVLAAGGGMPALSVPASVLPAGGGGIIGGDAVRGANVAHAAGGLGSRLLNTGARLGVGLGANVLAKKLSKKPPKPPPDLQALLDLQKNRLALQNPLFEAITRLAMSRLPTAQQQPMPGGAGANPMDALQRLSNPWG